MKNCPLLLFILFCVIFSPSTLGQNTGNLQTELTKAKYDTARIRILLNISDGYTYSDSKKALEFIAKAKAISDKTDMAEAKADILLQEGRVYNMSGNYTKALEGFEKALSLYHKLNLDTKIATSQMWIGIINSQLSNYGKALNNYSEALKTFKKAGSKRGMAKCNKLMATIYTSQGDFKKALDYLQHAISLSDDKHEIAKMYINVALNHYSAGNYEKSLSYFDSIVPVLKEMNDLDGLAKVYGNFGTTYIDVKNYKKAKEYLKTAINYSNQLGNFTNLLYVQTSLSELYTEMNQPDSAIILLKQGIELNKQLNIGELFGYMYYDISEAYEKKGDTKSALAYYKKYHEVSDSAVKQLADQKLMDIQTQWEVDKKNEQISLLDKDKKLATQKAITLGIGLIAVIIAGLCIFIYKYRKNREKQLLYEVELKEAAYKVDLKHRELAHKAINLSQKEQILANIKQQLENVKIENTRGKETLLGVLSGIDMELKQNSMEDFEKYFIEVHPEFYNSLKHKYTELTQTELRVCALIRLNLNSKEIADLTHKTVRSVEATRASIRKKMGLVKENLFDIIAGI